MSLNTAHLCSWSMSKRGHINICGSHCCGQLWVWHMFCGQDLWWTMPLHIFHWSCWDTLWIPKDHMDLCQTPCVQSLPTVVCTWVVLVNLKVNCCYKTALIGWRPIKIVRKVICTSHVMLRKMKFFKSIDGSICSLNYWMLFYHNALCCFCGSIKSHFHLHLQPLCKHDCPSFSHNIPNSL